MRMLKVQCVSKDIRMFSHLSQPSSSYPRPVYTGLYLYDLCKMPPLSQNWLHTGFSISTCQFSFQEVVLMQPQNMQTAPPNSYLIQIHFPGKRQVCTKIWAIWLMLTGLGSHSVPWPGSGRQWDKG